MLQALFYKEWIKTRKVILVATILFACFITYSFINIEQLFRINGAVQTWVNIILKDITLLSGLEYLPILFGILLALAQYVPEMTNKRLKLTLHLPLSETKTIFSMLLYGFVTLIILFVITYGILISGMNCYLPREIIMASVWTSLPWFFAGIIGYFLSAWICIEPVWRQRIFNTIIGICLLSFFFIDSKSGAYASFLPYMVICLILVFFYPFYSMSRFKDGIQ